MRYSIPKTDHVITAVGHDGIYVHPQPNLLIEGADVRLSDGYDSKGNVVHARAGLIFDSDTDSQGNTKPGVVYRNHDLRRCRFRGAYMWNVRRHAMEAERGEECLTEDVLCEDAAKEHNGYDSVRKGRAIYRRVTALNGAAQGWQLRLANNRADDAWANPKFIQFEDFVGLENGKPQGAGRAGFTLSIKDLGPESDVEIINSVISTRRSRAVKVSNGVTYDSFGGLCVEFCRSLIVRNVSVNMRNPDRNSVQLFDFSRKDLTKTGPLDTLYENSFVPANQFVAVRLDGGRARFTNCRGRGSVKVYRFSSGAWRLYETVPITSGYSH